MGASVKTVLKFFLRLGIYIQFTARTPLYYPFPSAENALTFDWDNIGTDITTAISKYGKIKYEKLS